MDWDFAVERHRVPLLDIVEKLFAEIGLTEDGMIDRLSRPVYRKVLGLLRKTESAVRRLIFVAARNIVLEPPARRPARATPKVAVKDKGKASGEITAESKDDGGGEWESEVKRKRRMSFGLFDPSKRFEKGYRGRPKRPPAKPPLQIVDVSPDPRMPLYLVFRPAPPPVPVAEEKADDGMVNAIHLCRRLFAVMAALQNLQAQAMRLARWQARPVEERRPARWSPLRPGRPPGFRQRAKHEVDEILKECDWLAHNVMPPLDDTS